MVELGTTDDRISHLVAHSNGISRTEIAHLLGLPSPTVTSAVRRLLAEEAVVEREHEGPRSVSGRRPHLLYTPGIPRCLGLVTWTQAGVDLAVADYGGCTLQSARADLPDPGANPAAFGAAIDELQRLARRVRPRRELSTVVISVPAPFQQGVGSPGQRLAVRGRGADRAGAVQPGAPHFYAGLPEDPAAALGEQSGVPVYLENDANLAALGEYGAGAGRARPDLLYVLLNDHGIGCGLIVGGRLVRGATGYAGELAHVQIDAEGPLCVCGGRGCLTTRLGNALLESVQGAYADVVTFEDLLTMAAQGEPGPGRVLFDLGRLVGRPLADVCTVLNPGMIVVDGRLGPASSFVVDGLREQIERFTPPAIGKSVDIVVGALGDDVAVHGAIELARTGR